MDMVKRLEPLWLLLMMLVAINWAIHGLTDTNVIGDLFSATVEDVIYVVAGVGALTFVPRLLEELPLGRGAHPRGA
jgi:uncharacterized membrane protein YuzA (DUF378 family)